VSGIHPPLRASSTTNIRERETEKYSPETCLSILRSNSVIRETKRRVCRTLHSHKSASISTSSLTYLSVAFTHLPLNRHTDHGNLINRRPVVGCVQPNCIHSRDRGNKQSYFRTQASPTAIMLSLELRQPIRRHVFCVQVPLPAATNSSATVCVAI